MYRSLPSLLKSLRIGSQDIDIELIPRQPSSAAATSIAFFLGPPLESYTNPLLLDKVSADIVTDRIVLG
jgi:hypothetical protein